MTSKEIDRHGIIIRLVNKEINGTKAASLLHLSIRQTKRLKVKVEKHGIKGLAHASRGKIGETHRTWRERRSSFGEILIRQVVM